MSILSSCFASFKSDHHSFHFFISLLICIVQELSFLCFASSMSILFFLTKFWKPFGNISQRWKNLKLSFLMFEIFHAWVVGNGTHQPTKHEYLMLTHPFVSLAYISTVILHKAFIHCFSFRNITNLSNTNPMLWDLTDFWWILLLNREQVILHQNLMRKFSETCTIWQQAPCPGTICKRSSHLLNSFGNSFGDYFVNMLPFTDSHEFSESISLIALTVEYVLKELWLGSG